MSAVEAVGLPPISVPLNAYFLTLTFDAALGRRLRPTGSPVL